MSRITDILERGLASLVFIDYDRMENGEAELHKAIDKYTADSEQAILALFDEAIGPDDQPSLLTGALVFDKEGFRKALKARNELRAEIRKKVGLS